MHLTPAVLNDSKLKHYAHNGFNGQCPLLGFLVIFYARHMPFLALNQHDQSIDDRAN